ncbi:UDP-glucose 4-epimerase GalE [Chryseotalea sanaruensis]|uniref:UDP-glucose 4-epimerase n=1 Tax=Chryseotalea sanaruensis TaxID=2482724 RepID=A0A401UC55_9BACT|nr:UDP-glucose 4-epimerase GalE [Chryseotalea sanaruensis]GCC52454.1 UDP-glucose 4-epimerase GalE [Chryseotalea sanaruensis]
MGKKKNIAVTGGAGYIGSHAVIQLIEAGFDVIIIDNLSRSDQRLLEGLRKISGINIPFYKIDCTNYSQLEEIFKDNQIDAVIHFAAYKAVGESVEKPLEYYENNVLSLVTLLKCMQKYKVTKLIFSSSCTVYGEPDVVPVTEKTSMKRANSPYGATKQMCERILEDVQPIGIDAVSLRYFNPIGAHPSGLIGELPLGAPNNLVPYITQTAAGLRDHLTVFGNDYNTVDGTCVRDYIHVTDLAEAHIKALKFIDNEQGLHIFNIGTGVGCSVMELINQFEEVNNLKLNYVFGPRRPGDVEKVYADPSKSFEGLQWKPRYSIKEALQHAWQWEKNIRSVKQ